jgi:microcystin degradation protein MlrC
MTNQMRIFSAGLGTETNTFAPLPTGLDAFAEHGYYPGGQHPQQMSFYGAPLFVARERGASLGWKLHEGLVTGAQPGGLTTRSAYEALRDTILTDLRAALPVDIVLLGLHGAMVADGYPDCEGDLLQSVRALVGPKTIVGAELDPHVHLSQTMVDAADLLVMFKEYPHTDILARAYELVDLCAAKAAGAIAPVAAVVDCEMVVPFHTTRSPAKDIVARMQALEGHDGILSVSLSHGFATGDVPDMGTKVLVYADGDAARAQAVARQLADEIIALRDQLRVDYLGIDEAIDAALTSPLAPVALADRSDNPGSGAPGDATFMLRRLIERNVQNAALGPLWDPGAVRVAFAAGVGAALALRIGGKTGPSSGDPVDCECTVKALVPEMTMTSLADSQVQLGDCALVQTGGIEIVLTSLRHQALNVDLFTRIGCDPASKKLLVLKSAQHFHASFSKVAPLILYVAAPGAASPHHHLLPYRNIKRPKWPL